MPFALLMPYNIYRQRRINIFLIYHLISENVGKIREFQSTVFGGKKKRKTEHFRIYSSWSRESNSIKLPYLTVSSDIE